MSLWYPTSDTSQFANVVGLKLQTFTEATYIQELMYKFNELRHSTANRGRGSSTR